MRPWHVCLSNYLIGTTTENLLSTKHLGYMLHRYNTMNVWQKKITLL